MTNNKVKADMIKLSIKGNNSKATTGQKKSSNILWKGWNIARETRENRNNHKAAVIWFTGLSGVGKTTIAKLLEKNLFDKGAKTILLDGDIVRRGLCKDLGFSISDREENNRRIAEVAKLLYEHGNIVICSLISPFIKDRLFARNLIANENFIEIYLECTIDILIKRDTKGLYKKALNGKLKDFTGITSPYERPDNPEITIDTSNNNINSSVDKILKLLKEKQIIK